MAVIKFDYDMKIIQALDDQPNDVGGLTAAELKAKFDEGGEALKEYINNTLIPSILDTFALQSDLDGAVIGVSPDLRRTEEVLSRM